MALTYFTVEDNSAPSLQITLKRNRHAIDLTGSVVEMAIQNKKTKEITNDGHQTCALVNDEEGIMSYPVEVGDFPDPSVDYLAEVKITYSSGKVERIYDQLVVSVRPKIF